MENLWLSIYQLTLYNFWHFVFIMLLFRYKKQNTFTKGLLLGTNSIFLGILLSGSIIAIKWKMTNIVQPDEEILNYYEGICLICSSLLYLFYYLINSLQNNSLNQLIVVYYWHFLTRSFFTTLQMSMLTGGTSTPVVLLGFIVSLIIISIVLILLTKSIEYCANIYHYLYIYGVAVYISRGLGLTDMANILSFTIYNIPDCCSLSGRSWMLVFNYIFGIFGTLRIGEIVLTIVLFQFVIIICLILRLMGKSTDHQVVDIPNV